MKTLERTFKALSDETRLRILALIFRHGHLCPCEVEQLLGITQSKASRHLRYLRDAGLLEDRRSGLIVNYHLPEAPDPERASLLSFLADLLRERGITPEAAPLLVQIRGARAQGEAASSVGGSA